MTKLEIERTVTARGYRYCNSWRADRDDMERGIDDTYFPFCEEGDLLVSLGGHHFGSVSWVENWGKGE